MDFPKYSCIICWLPVLRNITIDHDLLNSFANCRTLLLITLLTPGVLFIFNLLNFVLTVSDVTAKQRGYPTGTRRQINVDFTLITRRDVVDLVINVESTLLWRRRNSGWTRTLIQRTYYRQYRRLSQTVAFLPMIYDNLSKFDLPVPFSCIAYARSTTKFDIRIYRMPEPICTIYLIQLIEFIIEKCVDRFLSKNNYFLL